MEETDDRSLGALEIRVMFDAMKWKKHKNRPLLEIPIASGPSRRRIRQRRCTTCVTEEVSRY
jgi:hypothetical protein